MSMLKVGDQLDNISTDVKAHAQLLEEFEMFCWSSRKQQAKRLSDINSTLENDNFKELILNRLSIL
jgi:transketolase N-terminal domain/subunit